MVHGTVKGAFYSWQAVKSELQAVHLRRRQMAFLHISAAAVPKKLPTESPASG